MHYSAPVSCGRVEQHEVHGRFRRRTPSCGSCSTALKNGHETEFMAQLTYAPAGMLAFPIEVHVACDPNWECTSNSRRGSKSCDPVVDDRGRATACAVRRVGPGNCTPSRSQGPDVNLSLHPARATRKKAAASRQDKQFLRFPVDSILTRVTCPLRSTGITPLHRYY